MHPNSGRAAHELARDELHAELMARNLFRVVMLGAAAFVSVCAYVLAQ